MKHPLVSQIIMITLLSEPFWTPPSLAILSFLAILNKTSQRLIWASTLLVLFHIWLFSYCGKSDIVPDIVSQLALYCGQWQGVEAKKKEINSRPSLDRSQSLFFFHNLAGSTTPPPTPSYSNRQRALTKNKTPKSSTTVPNGQQCTLWWQSLWSGKEKRALSRVEEEDLNRDTFKPVTPTPSPDLHGRLVWSTLAWEEPLLEQRRGKVEPIAMATQLAAFFLPSRVTWQPALAFQCQIPEKHTALATAGSPARSVTETGGNYQMSGKIWESAFQKEDIFIPTSCSCQSVC